MDLFNHRGVGSRWRNDGVMMLVAPGDRKVRIQLGSAYGSGWSPAMQAVIDNHMLPDFRRGQLGQGIINGIRALLNTLKTDQLTSQAGAVPSTNKTSFREALSEFLSVGKFLLIPLLFICWICASIAFSVRFWSQRLSNRPQSGYRSGSSSSSDDDRYHTYTSDSDSFSTLSNSDSFSSSSDDRGDSCGGGASGSW
ncbi:MAG: hypothetical protein KatS3mg067_1869 [Thermosynechococcus sp.]|nr:MAG: hypothetical protein KatS3mg067_1869 [Thermosynechococcus sp.]